MGDYVRWAPPYYEGAEPTAPVALFLALNRGKRSIRIDLKTDAGRDVLLRLARDADVLLESFRPGVLDRLGVGYERAARGEPAARLLRDHAATARTARYARPLRARHELPRPRRPARPHRRRRRAAGAGGGPDRRPRRRRADGRVRDPRRAARARPLGRGPARRRLDGRRRAVVAGDGRRARTSPTRRARRGAASSSSAGALALLPARTACADGWVTLGALEPKFWPAWCRGVGREDLVEHQFERARLRRARRGRGGSSPRARATSGQAFAAEHDCCLEPVLDLDEALDSELVRAREMVVELDQPGAGPVQAARRCRSSSRARRATRARARARRWASTPTRCWPRPATPRTRSPRCTRPARSPARPAASQGSFLA